MKNQLKSIIYVFKNEKSIKINVVDSRNDDNINIAFNQMVSNNAFNHMVSKKDENNRNKRKPLPKNKSSLTKQAMTTKAIIALRIVC